MQFIHHSIQTPEAISSLRLVDLAVDRFKLQKRRWRGIAGDGTEFGFELDEPLAHGTIFHCTADCVYRIAQEPETVLEADFGGATVEGLKVGWSVGNLHMPMQVCGETIRVADDPAVRQLFGHLNVEYREVAAVFEPIRPSARLGHDQDHGHDHGHGHGDGHVHGHGNGHDHARGPHSH